MPLDGLANSRKLLTELFIRFISLTTIASNSFFSESDVVLSPRISTE